MAAHQRQGSARMDRVAGSLVSGTGIPGSQRHANGREHLLDGLLSFGDRQRGAVIIEWPDKRQTRGEQHVGRLDRETSLCDRLLHDVDGAQEGVDHRRRWQHGAMRRCISGIATPGQQLTDNVGRNALCGERTQNPHVRPPARRAASECYTKSGRLVIALGLKSRRVAKPSRGFAHPAPLSAGLLSRVA